MDNFISLVCTIEYIENHLDEEITLEDISANAYISLSHLHRIFRTVFHCSLKDYLIKRRLCRAGYDLIHTDNKITDIAFKYR